MISLGSSKLRSVDFDFLNWMGSSKLKREAGVVAETVHDRFAGSWRRAGGGALDAMSIPAVHDG